MLQKSRETPQGYVPLDSFYLNKVDSYRTFLSAFVDTGLWQCDFPHISMGWS